MSKIKLKRCPFCGSVPEIVAYRGNMAIHAKVFCMSMDCRVVPVTVYSSFGQDTLRMAKEKAAEQWNQRKAK